MSEAERRALESAVKHLNAVLAGLCEAHGDKLQIRPHANYNTEDGYAQVVVEVTTGVEKFR